MRLIDIVPVAGVICGLLAAALAWRAGRTTTWVRRRKDVRGMTVAASVVMTVVVALPALIAVGTFVHDRGRSVDTNCWTF